MSIQCINTNLVHYTIADVDFFLSLWESDDPIDILVFDSKYYISVDAKYNGCGKINASYSQTFNLGVLPAINIIPENFQERLKALIKKFFKNHPDIIEVYNKYHPGERIELK